ncbi:hypothetical protein HYV86_04815 [Candidatus Woesearchaeota archaeon]|nr:hypothetical protein [Candidatus Woesearchaeota archaeon]
MVIENFREIISPLVMVCAATSAISGIIVLQKLFHNRLKELFDDSNYFIFLFMVLGYSLYALGEVSLYLMEKIEHTDASIGMADIYWAAGAILLVVSYISLVHSLLKKNKDSSLPLKFFGLGVGIVGVVSYFLFMIIAPSGAEISFFSYFYPFISSIIVSLAMSNLFFSRYIGDFAQPLMFFFIASCAILVGDVLFTLTTAQGTYLEGSMGAITDLLYMAGYLLAAGGFWTLRKSMHALAEK